MGGNFPENRLVPSLPLVQGLSSPLSLTALVILDHYHFSTVDKSGLCKTAGAPTPNLNLTSSGQTDAPHCSSSRAVAGPGPGHVC